MTLKSNNKYSLFYFILSLAKFEIMSRKKKILWPPVSIYTWALASSDGYFIGVSQICDNNS